MDQNIRVASNGRSEVEIHRKCKAPVSAAAAAAAIVTAAIAAQAAAAAALKTTAETLKEASSTR